MLGKLPFIVFGTLSPIVVYLFLLQDIRTFSGNKKGFYFKNVAFPRKTKQLSQRGEPSTADESEKKIKKWFKNDDADLPLKFDFLISPEDLCPSGETLDYIMMIYSATSNFRNRQTIRDTFGSRNASVYISQRIVFLTGSVNTSISNHAEITVKMKKEAKQHGDLVQGDFMDTYNNLTLKGLAGLRWIDAHCKGVKFVIKTDDDTFVNIFRVVKVVLPQLVDLKYVISGMVHNQKANEIIRLGDKHPKKYQAKWAVPGTIFPGMTHFPFHYPNGLFVIMSRDLVQPLVKASQRVPFFYLEDVYLYGLLTDAIGNVTMVGLNGFFNAAARRQVKQSFDCFRRLASSCDAIAVFDGGEKMIRQLWTLSNIDRTFQFVSVCVVVVIHIFAVALSTIKCVRYIQRRR